MAVVGLQPTLPLLAGPWQKGTEPEAGFRGPEGHQEASKGHARAWPKAGHGCRHLGPSLTRMSGRSLRRAPSPSLAKVAHGDLLPGHVPVC